MNRVKKITAIALTASALSLGFVAAPANAAGVDLTAAPSGHNAELEAAVARVIQLATADQPTGTGTAGLDPADTTTGTTGLDAGTESVTLEISGITSAQAIAAITRAGGTATVASSGTDTGFDTGGFDTGLDTGLGTDTGLDPSLIDAGLDTGSTGDTTSTTDGAPAGDKDATDAGDCEDDTGKDPQGNPCVDDEDDAGGNDSEGSQ